MKTPEEIKKGLEYCGNLDRGCAGCPYDDDCSTQGKGETVELDAIAYIQQLEETVARQKERYRSLLETASILSDAVDELERCATDGNI